MLDSQRSCQHQVDSGYVKISRTEDQHGAQVARNRGLEMALGDFVLFLDSDDVLTPGGLVELYEVLRGDEQLEYAYGKVVRCNEKLEPLADAAPVGSAFSDAPYDIAGYHWHTMGALYRKSYLDRVGHWNLDLTGSQDWEYQARVKLGAGKWRFIDSVIGYWRQHDGERVGAKKFRPDYVKSVMVACGVILDSAREGKRCDAALEKRLAKKLVVHAIEWGANGYLKERKECIRQARAGLSSGWFFKAALFFAQNTPAVFDGAFLQFLQRSRAK